MFVARMLTIFLKMAYVYVLLDEFAPENLD